MSLQPLKYCADCGAVIAGPDTPRRRYNALKYCPNCAAYRIAWSKARNQKQVRLDRKERNRLLRQEAALLRERCALQEERIAALTKLNQEARGYV